MATTNSPIGNNVIYMQKKGSAEQKDTTKTVLFGAEMVDVGINSGNKEIATDPDSGWKYERDAIVSKTIYNLQKQKHSCFFILDLETGRGGKSWYPGCIQKGDITASDVAIKSEMSETSQTLITVSNVTVRILDLDYDANKNIWYKILYNEIEGYVRNTYISNTRYTDPD